jgi:uncharacterized protein YcaQ
MKTKLSLEEARNHAVTAQRLNIKQNQQEIQVIDLIRQIGYLQIDTISVVARTHEHTLWARKPDFSAGLLYAAQRDDRSIFEYWAHAMSFIPIEHYRYFLPLMKAFHNHENSWAKQRYDKYGHMVDDIYQRVKTEGPMKSRDFTPENTEKGKSWWDWRPEKIVLELLLWRGDLMVSERQGFQKVYDITERVLPDWVNTQYPTNEEIGCYVVEQALLAYGIASEKDITGLYHDVTMETVKQGVKALLDMGKIGEIVIESRDGQSYYVLAKTLENHAIDHHAVSILSPFDNLIIQRDRLSQLFSFTYTLECYLPAAKRVYGYYVMPVLYGNQFVGRLDPKADRKRKNFILRNIYFEEAFAPDDIFYTSFAGRLKSMMIFNGCETISIEGMDREKEKQSLLAALKLQEVEIQAIQ